MSEKDILDILENWSEEFEVVDILASGARNIGFKLAKAMADITAELEGAARQIYSLLSVLITDSKLGDTITAFKPLLVILLSLSIMLTGYLLIFKKDGKSNLLQSAMIVFLVLTVMPLTASKVADLTSASSQTIFGVMEGGSAAAYDIIDDNIVDLYMLMDDDLLTKSAAEREHVLKGRKNAFTGTKKSIELIKISSKLDYDENDYAEYQTLTQKQVDVDASGKTYLVKLNGGIFNVTHNYYYRYHVNWLPMLTSLVAMFLTLLLTCVRLAKMIWEIILNMFVAPFVAVTDVATGQRTKELLRNLLSMFAVMGLISVIIGTYNLGMSLLSSLYTTGKIGMVLHLTLLVALASLTIEGPSILQRIYGVDAGGRGPLGMLSNLYYGTRLAKGGMQAVAGTAAGAFKTGKKAAEKGKDFYQKQKAKKSGGYTGINAELQKQQSAGDLHGESKTAAAGSSDAHTGSTGSGQAEREKMLRAQEASQSNQKDSLAAEKGRTRSVQGEKPRSVKPETSPISAKPSSRSLAEKTAGSAGSGRTTQTGISAGSPQPHMSRNAGTGNTKSLQRAAGPKTSGIGAASSQTRSLTRAAGQAGHTVRSPKVSGIRRNAEQGNLTVKNIRQKENHAPTHAAHGRAGQSREYQNTDNRIIRSIREKEALAANRQPEEKLLVQTSAQDKTKNFGRRRTLK